MLKYRQGEVEHTKPLAEDARFPIFPPHLVQSIRDAMPDDGIICLDNGVYKIWFARGYTAYRPNTVLLDHALATMGAGLPLSAGSHPAQSLDEHGIGLQGSGVVEQPVEHLVVARGAHVEQFLDGLLLGTRVLPPVPLEREHLAVALGQGRTRRLEPRCRVSHQSLHTRMSDSHYRRGMTPMSFVPVAAGPTVTTVTKEVP